MIKLKKLIKQVIAPHLHIQYQASRHRYI